MTKPTLQHIAFMFMLSGMSLVSSHGYAGYLDIADDEDTILVEWRPMTKIPYNRIVRQLSKKLFNFDTQNALSFGEGRRQNVARNFSDYLDRSKTRLNVRRDEIEVKFRVNF